MKRDAVQALDITGPEGAYALAKDDKGEWAFVRPLATRAGRWSVDGLVGTLESLRMDVGGRGGRQRPAPVRPRPPARTVTIGLAGGATRTLEIGSSAVGKERYHAHVAGSPLVVVVPGALVDDLAKGMGELRAKRLLEVAAYEVEGFDVEAAGMKRATRARTAQGRAGRRHLQVEAHRAGREGPGHEQGRRTRCSRVGGIEVRSSWTRPKAPAAYGLDAPALRVSAAQRGRTSAGRGSRSGRRTAPPTPGAKATPRS